MRNLANKMFKIFKNKFKSLWLVSCIASHQMGQQYVSPVFTLINLSIDGCDIIYIAMHDFCNRYLFHKKMILLHFRPNVITKFKVHDWKLSKLNYFAKLNNSFQTKLFFLTSKVSKVYG